MPYEKLLELLEEFANVSPGENGDAMHYIFATGEICALYSQYVYAKANSDEELMQEIGERISCKVQKYL